MNISKFIPIWIIILTLSLFGNSQVESINLSLKSLGSQESLNDTNALDATLERYNRVAVQLYKRYQQTEKTHTQIKEKFINAGIPTYFSLIPYAESNFNPNIRGYGTVGLWQFNKQTARNFGLTVTKSNDERQDINRSTDAAIKYLLYLKREFKEWYLVDFAYAMGEGTVRRLIQHNGSKKLSVLFKDPHFSTGAKAHFAKTLYLDAKIHFSDIEEKEPRDTQEENNPEIDEPALHQVDINASIDINTSIDINASIK